MKSMTVDMDRVVEIDSPTGTGLVPTVRLREAVPDTFRRVVSIDVGEDGAGRGEDGVG